MEYNEKNSSSQGYNVSEGEYTYGQGREYTFQEKPKKSLFRGVYSTTTKKVAIILVVALLAGSVFGGAFAVTNHFVGTALGEDTQSFSIGSVQTSSGKTSSDFGGVIGVVKNSMPSVVSITNVGVTEIKTFFGSFEQEQQSSGSGVIIGEEGNDLLIVTNYHVIAGSKELTVVFSFDENQSDVTKDKAVEAKVKGYDSSKDIAVISVDLGKLSKETRSKLKVAVLGKSEDLALGQEVVAIGNALGYGQSVTTGVISAKARQMTISSDGMTFSGKYLQTNAAINPGNSGGALLNMNGELIGINAAKIASSQVDSIGYAIPIDEVTPIIEKIMNNSNRNEVPESERGYLGISGQTVTQDARQQYGMPEGVYVAEVIKASGADKAGLAKGCIITAVDGSTITSMEELQNHLKLYKVGEKITVTVATAGMNGFSSEDISVTLSTAKAAGITKN